MPYYESELSTWSPPTAATLRGAPKWNVVKTDFTMSRLSQRVSYQSELIESLTLACNGLREEEFAGIRDLYVDCQGSLKPFKLVFEGQERYVIILAFDWEKVTPVSYNVHLTLEQVPSVEIIEE